MQSWYSIHTGRTTRSQQLTTSLYLAPSSSWLSESKSLLSDTASAAALLRSLPSLIPCLEQGAGERGVGLLLSHSCCFQSLLPTFSSSEHHRTQSLLLLHMAVLYCPPNSSPSVFLFDFDFWFSSPSFSHILVDFNFHIDDPYDSLATHSSLSDWPLCIPHMDTNVCNMPQSRKCKAVSFGPRTHNSYSRAPDQGYERECGPTTPLQFLLAAAWVGMVSSALVHNL